MCYEKAELLLICLTGKEVQPEWHIIEINSDSDIYRNCNQAKKKLLLYKMLDLVCSLQVNNWNPLKNFKVLYESGFSRDTESIGLHRSSRILIYLEVYQTTWRASWETYMQVRKQHLELDMEQQMVPNRKRSTSRLYIVT